MKYQLSPAWEKPLQLPLIDRISRPLGMVLLGTMAIGLGLAAALGGIKMAMLALVAMVALPAVYAVIVYPLFGMVTLLSLGFFLFFILRFGINFPLGTLMDGLVVMLLLGFMIKLKQRGDWDVRIYRNPVSVMLLVWIGYNILQVANPWASSRMAWVYTVRPVAIITMLYFVFVYYLRSVQWIRVMLVTWLLLALCGAIYGFKQEFFGIAQQELAELWADPQMVSLLFINGAWRKYSIFSDPVSFSYSMVCASLICVALLSAKISWIKRMILAGMICVFLLAMLYSGTRGAYVLVPAALIPFALLNFSRQIMFGSCIAAFFIVILIFMPTSSPTILRFQTAFRPSDDASFNVRKYNQKRIQPYILSHPFGGGLGATGAWGARFAPNSFLAKFPPDSGYMRVAVELGWVGLLIFCFMMFAMLRMGIINFYRIHNPELKIYCLAMTLVLFALNIGNFPQEALVQFPSNILFYLAAAIVHTTYLIDRKQTAAAAGKD